MFEFSLFGKNDLNLSDLISLGAIIFLLFYGYILLVVAIGTGRAIDFLWPLIFFAIAGAIYWRRKQQVLKHMRVEAVDRETALDYDAAIEIWEELEEFEEAGRLRKLRAEMKSSTLSKTVIHGDQIHGNQVTSTEVKDSVLNRSIVGSGYSRMQELEKLNEMKDRGAIDDAEFQQMKKEILS